MVYGVHAPFFMGSLFAAIHSNEAVATAVRAFSGGIVFLIFFHPVEKQLQLKWDSTAGRSWFHCTGPGILIRILNGSEIIEKMVVCCDVLWSVAGIVLGWQSEGCPSG